MFKYVKKYLPLIVIAVIFLVGEVLADLLQPFLMSKIVDDGILGLNVGTGAGVGAGASASDLQLILALGLKMILIAITGAALGVFCNVLLQTVSNSIGNDLRKDVFSKIMTFSFDKVDKFSTGSLITRLTNDTSQVQFLIPPFVRIATRTSLMIFGSLFFVYNLNQKFGYIMLIALPLIFLITVICVRSANPLFSKYQEQLDDINNILQEDISGIRMIKACVREVYENIRFSKANDALIKTQMKAIIIISIMSPTINAVLYLAVAGILLVGAVEVESGFATPGEIMASITYTTQILGGMLLLAMLFQNTSRGLISLKRINEVLIDEPTLKDGEFSGKTETKGAIEFKDVSFSYPGSDKYVLKSINLKINPGETVAIMGATGSGKTSLVNLIPRFYDVSAGDVLVDGVNVKNYKQNKLRDKISIAIQKSEIFSATIKENIGWGNLNADFEMIRKAAEISQAANFIRKLESGYETKVLERGMSLSGGQRQRIAIARAILKPADILIFDDSTSALDLKTESEFYKALKKSRPNTTKIIVAQRIASVKSVDKIAVLDDGKISAVGKHEDLLNTCKIYREIFESQMGESQTDESESGVA
ncbi:MAG: ABC transporter ATP-binding protein [Methanosarcinaceae archaeon]|nr:ABC transporter ATP-binding protein [Methanosarcinaceae archaeon]